MTGCTCRPPTAPDWDNKTGTAVLVDGADQAAFDTALASHRGDRSPAAVAAPAQAAAVEPPPLIPVQKAVRVETRVEPVGDVTAPVTVEPEPPQRNDLANAKAGAAARGGRFTINTKHHPNSAVWVGGNTFMVDGQRVPYVRNSRFEAHRTSKFLTVALGGAPVTTTGVIAVMGARKGFTVKAQPPDGAVIVITRREVAKWLAKRPVVLTDVQVEALYAVARRSETWR